MYVWIDRRQTQKTAERYSTGLLLPSDDFTQAGPTGTPYNKNASRNEITVSPGTQTVIINFQVATCSGSQLYNVKFITWKPDPYDDTTPNRKETTFKLKGDEHNEP